MAVATMMLLPNKAGQPAAGIVKVPAKRHGVVKSLYGRIGPRAAGQTMKAVHAHKARH